MCNVDDFVWESTICKVMILFMVLRTICKVMILFWRTICKIMILFGGTRFVWDNDM